MSHSNNKRLGTGMQRLEERDLFCICPMDALIVINEINLPPRSRAGGRER